jgi:membrane protein implicated in regulation of membrane protease activity
MTEPLRSRVQLLSRWIAGLLLVIPIVCPLVVGTYDRGEPELAGFPFFYWYQFVWILIGAVLTAIAYWLVSREKRQGHGGDDSR